MSLRACTVALLSFVMPACQPSDGPSNNSPPFDADREIGRWLEAWNTRDLARVDELFLNDTSVTYFSSEREGLIRGLSAIRDHHAGFGFVPGGNTATDELWVEDIQVGSHPAAAVVSGIWFFGDHKAGPDGLQRGPMTAIYVLDGGTYRIAHMHFSDYPQETESAGVNSRGGTR